MTSIRAARRERGGDGEGSSKYGRGGYGRDAEGSRRVSFERTEGTGSVRGDLGVLVERFRGGGEGKGG